MLIDEPFFAKDTDDIAENISRKYAIGQLFVEGDNRYLSADLMSLFSFLAIGSRKYADIERILFMRGQENNYDTDELYALFTDFTPEEIEEIYTQMKEGKWQFTPPEERELFLRSYLLGEHFESYIELFCDFRHNGDRVFSDIICDRYAENKLNNLTSLHFENEVMK